MFISSINLFIYVICCSNYETVYEPQPLVKNIIQIIAVHVRPPNSTGTLLHYTNARTRLWCPACVHSLLTERLIAGSKCYNVGTKDLQFQQHFFYFGTFLADMNFSISRYFRQEKVIRANCTPCISFTRNQTIFGTQGYKYSGVQLGNFDRYVILNKTYIAFLSVDCDE